MPSIKTWLFVLWKKSQIDEVKMYRVSWLALGRFVNLGIGTGVAADGDRSQTRTTPKPDRKFS